MKRFNKLFLLALALLVFLPLSRHACAQTATAQAAAPASNEASSSSTSIADEEQEIDESKQYKESPSVQAMGRMVGLNPGQAATAFELANFAILAIIIGFFLAKALPKLFRSRNSAIQKHLVDARTATEQATIRLSGVEARLAKLDGEIAAMRTQADKDSAADEQRIQASVEEEKKKILASAEQEIAAATAAARRDIQKYAAELAIEQAARKLVISAETDRLLVQNFARRLGGDDSKEGQN